MEKPNTELGTEQILCNTQLPLPNTMSPHLQLHLSLHSICGILGTPWESNYHALSYFQLTKIFKYPGNRPINKM